MYEEGYFFLQIWAALFSPRFCAYSVRRMPRHITARRLALIVCLLALGVVGGASGRALATTTITVQVIGGGQVTSGGGQITCGAGSQQCYYSTTSSSGSVTLTAVAQSGWSFGGWQGCTTSGTNNEICTITLGSSGGDNEVTATFTSVSVGTKTLSVTQPTGGNVSGGEIDCGSEASETDCSWIVTTDSTITLLEDPDSGSTFGGWGGACSGSNRTCTVTMTADRDVTATFTTSATTFALTVSVTGNGTVAGSSISCTSAGGSSCSAEVSAGTTVALTAQPNSGATFNGWGGACAGTSLSCSVTMSSAKSVTASFSGSSGTASQFPLGVSVTGNGTVTGGGISCGSGETTCTVNESAGATVTLTATPDSGASFTSWGGACSGSSTTCTVTMNAAKSVTATFTGGTTSGTGTVSLTVTVTGPGSVSGGGIQCGNGGKTCSAKETEDSDVTLTATPTRTATFTGWDGACSGTDTTCKVTMDAAKSVSAAFKSTSRTPSAAAGSKMLKSRGRAMVRRTANGFLVTLRFVTTRRGIAHVRAVLAGRLQTALSFPVAPGTATVGPFSVVKPGFYAFELRLGPRQLRWAACLGRCGAAVHAPPFVLVRGPARAVDAGAVWSLTVNFRATMPSGAQLRILRSGRLARNVRFPAPAGAVTTGPFLLSPGTYQLRLTATDVYGRVRTLSWYAFLA
jgi:Divergent InlB B-repeat domain